ncbi:MAG: hypothetical protein QNJ46_02385 [Leptolyngbyaceae cyanobacterium MO_188.B28]|nr:hypothetical protein [Leptolyngbyaceae cyanobacterium MO_188.B28]
MAHLAQNLISIAASIGILALAPMALAQQTIDPLEGLGPSEDSSGDFFNDSSNVFDLVHQVILTNPVSAAEYQERQHQNVNNAAAEFRRQRQEALRESGAIYSTPVVADEPEAASNASEAE